MALRLRGQLFFSLRREDAKGCASPSISIWMSIEISLMDENPEDNH